ncbi:MAG: outer membrane protein assembly factor BamB [Paraglaciecola sp.]|jgi:outer membrane protein assembly factor BamB
MKYIIIFLTILMFSCKKEETSPTIPPIIENPECCEYTGKLEVLWQTPLDKDTLEGISTEPVIVDKKVVFTLWPANPSDPELVTAYDLATGAIQWEWESVSTAHTSTKNSLFPYNGNVLYKASSKEVCLLDGSTSDIIWSYNPYDDGLRGSGVKVIGEGHNPPGTVKQSSTLVRGNMETGEIEDVLTQEIQNGFSPSLTTPVIWKNEIGETIMFIRNSQYNWDENNSKTDLIMYNYDLEEIEHEWKNITPSGGSSNQPPFIKNNKLFFIGWENVLCIDILTKEILWQTYTGNNFTGIAINDILILNSLDKNIKALDINTGDILWENADSGSTSSFMQHFDGIVYFGSLGRGRLYAVDIETGEHIWAESPPNRETGKYPGAAFLNGVAIDTVNRVLYTDDEYFVMGIKLPER